MIINNNELSSGYFKELYQRPVILQTKNLIQSFADGKQTRVILNNINLNIHEREFISIIGPSGCGKSTLSRIVAGLDPYTSGEILMHGNPIV